MTKAKKQELTKFQRAVTLGAGAVIIGGTTVFTAAAIPVAAVAGLVMRGAVAAAEPYADLGRRARKAWRELRAL